MESLAHFFFVIKVNKRNVKIEEHAKKKQFKSELG